ncbi:MAG: hypothetical protein HOW97_13540 [Catenulispora sp.]|nr:hypothetical protein [Catenulispora sp.]
MIDLASRERSVLEFAGLGGGVGELTWGQRFVWDILQALAPVNHYINVRLRVHLPTDASGERVLDALRALVREHEILRTRFPVDEDGEPRQQCDRAGELPVDLCQAEPGTVRKLADAEEERLWREPFQHDREWPLRVSVVAAGGRPRQVVFVFSHLAVDAWGCGVLRTRFLDLLRTSGTATTAALATATEPSGWQSRARAEFERSAPARELNQRFAAHWQRFLDTAPQTAFPVSPEAGETPLFPGVGLHSVALAAAVRALAVRLRVGPAAVLLGTASAFLGIRTDTGAVPLLLATGNRFSASDAASVGTYYQVAPALIGLDAGSLADTIRAADRTSKLSYLRGQGDPREVARLVAETTVGRGVTIDMATTVNVVPEPDAAAAATLSVPEIRELTGATRISELEGRDSEQLKFYLHAKALRSRAIIELFCDSRYLDRSTARKVLAGLEQVLIEVLDAGDLDFGRVAELTGIRPLTRPEGSVLSDGCWVDPEAVRRMLIGVCGTTQAQVFVTEAEAHAGAEAEGAPARLVAYVVTDQPATPEQLHDALIRRLDGNLTMTPHWYVLCRQAPARPESRPEWLRQAVVAQGSGRIDAHSGA